MTMKMKFCLLHCLRMLRALIHGSPKTYDWPLLYLCLADGGGSFVAVFKSQGDC